MRQQVEKGLVINPTAKLVLVYGDGASETWGFAIAVQILFHYFILQAGVFMGFSITSAVFGGIIIISYSVTIAFASYRRYYYDYEYDYRYGYVRTYRDQRYSYHSKMGLASVLLILGTIEFVTGILVSICLCVMKPCCTNSQVRFLLS